MVCTTAFHPAFPVKEERHSTFLKIGAQRHTPRTQSGTAEKYLTPFGILPALPIVFSDEGCATVPISAVARPVAITKPIG
jgi:hypothetical protein